MPCRTLGFASFLILRMPCSWLRSSQLGIHTCKLLRMFEHGLEINNVQIVTALLGHSTVSRSTDTPHVSSKNAPRKAFQFGVSVWRWSFRSSASSRLEQVLHKSLPGSFPSLPFVFCSKLTLFKASEFDRSISDHRLYLHVYNLSLFLPRPEGSRLRSERSSVCGVGSTLLCLVWSWDDDLHS